MSVLEWAHGDEFRRLSARLDQLAASEIATTIISYEEQARGWLAYLSRARKVAQQIEGYRRLQRHLSVYRVALVLDFDEAAAVEFQNLRPLRLRIGVHDQRIAAIALSQNATLLSRNVRDFSQVPGLRTEDWTSH